MIILQRIDRFLARVYLIAGIIAAVSIVLIGLSVVASVGSRILGVYISGVTELAGYAMAWAAFFGMAYTFRVGG
ncbi:MAG: TRAP transporter small permease, partial [Alphaproteobacteria bacterium]|nr:TRAP transporter small permease [Alphaproteobacteria bacterium]